VPRWEGCLKIHEGCGGQVRWVEAYETPGVGYHGECLHCDTEGLVLEDIIPVESGKAKRIVQNNAFSSEQQQALARIEWNEDQSWEKNQDRIKEALLDVL